MTRADWENQRAWLRANLDAERDVRAAAEEERNTALQFISEICQAFIPEELDQVLREHKIEVERWNPLDYRTFIITQGIARIRRLQMLSQGNPSTGSGQVLADDLARARAEIERLQGEVRELRDELAHVQAACNEAQAQVTARDDELAGLRDEVTRLRAELPKVGERESATAIQRDDLAPESESAAWFDRWRASRAHSLDAALIRVMGYRGFCLRKSIEMALVEEGVITPGSGAVQRLFTRVKEWGLIEEFEPRTEWIGRAPYLLRLTDRGCEAFCLLFDQGAVESEYDRLLARHKSDEHALLNIQTRDALLEHGAEVVDLYPRPVTLPSGGTFDVDLVAIFPDQSPLYVEAERGGLKNRQRRDRKWANYRQVTGDFYIVVPNKKVQAQIITEITLWAGQSRASLTLHVCNLSLLGKKGAALWHFERTIGRTL
jgi:hypothetical protein